MIPPGQARGIGLARRLGFWSAVGIVIGVTIGSGIFRTPAVIAGRVPDPMLALAVWLLGGILSLCGALSVAELAAALPHTGGWYVYLRESWGRLAGFLFGWAELVLIRASATGAISTVFSEYLLRSLGYDPSAYDTTADYIAATAIIGTAMVNIRGVEIGAAVAGLSTVAKSAALALLVLVSAALGGGAGASAAHFTAGAGPVDAGLFGLALVSVLWAYDGFADISFAAGGAVVARRGRHDAGDRRASRRRTHVGSRRDLDLRRADVGDADLATRLLCDGR
jgi:amino acid transporter